MNELFNYNINSFNLLVEVQTKVNQELMSIGRLIQDQISNKDATPEDWQKLQQSIVDHSAKINQMVQHVQTQIVSDGQKIAAQGVGDSQKMYQVLVDRFVEACRVSQEQYLKFFESSLEEFKKQSTAAKL